MEGTTHPITSRELEIVEALEVKDGRGAQVFLCCLDGERQEYVAKVYDPLYYGFANLMWSDLPRDVTYVADGDYTREVAAYEYLDNHDFRGPEVPAYYGSWTFDLPTDSQPTDSDAGNHSRSVRMILIEHIDGMTMLDMNLARTPTDYRLDVLSRMMEAESRLRHIGLNHNDVSPRNILVCGYDSIREGPTRVCLFDFNIAVITERSEDVVKKGIVPKKTTLPQSPVDLWWSRVDIEFGTWMPDGWDMRAWHQWLLDKYGNADGFERPERSLQDDEEEALGFSADDRPYGDIGDDAATYVRPLSPGFGANRDCPDDEHMDGALPHGSPKRRWSEVHGDGDDYELELRNEKIMAQNEAMFGAEDWSPDPVEQEPPLLGHLSIGVKDYETARRFFLALRPLGMHLVYDSEAAEPGSGIRTLGYGPDKTQELLNIFEYGDEAQPPGRGSHVAFNAPSREAVDEFYKEALVYGGTCDGKPGLRARYGPYYYAAFVISPDGWRLEAVCKKPD